MPPDGPSKLTPWFDFLDIQSYNADDSANAISSRTERLRSLIRPDMWPSGTPKYVKLLFEIFGSAVTLDEDIFIKITQHYCAIEILRTLRCYIKLQSSFISAEVVRAVANNTTWSENLTVYLCKHYRDRPQISTSTMRSIVHESGIPLPRAMLVLLLFSEGDNEQVCNLLRIATGSFGDLYGYRADPGRKEKLASISRCLLHLIEDESFFEFATAEGGDQLLSSLYQSMLKKKPRFNEWKVADEQRRKELLLLEIRRRIEAPS